MITLPALSALATVAIGGFCLVSAGRLAWRSWRAHRWPAVEGQLLSADLRRRRHVAAPGAWKLRVSYRYAMGTETHTAAEISPDGGPAFYNEELGRLAIAERWRPGTLVRVHVNPGDPEDALLAPRVSAATLLTLVLGAMIAAAGIGQLLWG